ncbi:hypothetical protein V8C86DRAFT_2814593, partial [Haematococcus lacustris]
MHFLCRIAASLGRCIAAPPSVFCRYLLILSLNLMASFCWLLLAAPGCLWGSQDSCVIPLLPSRYLWKSLASFA